MNQRFQSFLEDIDSKILSKKDKRFLVVSLYNLDSLSSSSLFFKYFYENEIESYFTFLDYYDKNIIQNILKGENSYDYDIIIFLGFGSRFFDLITNISKEIQKNVIVIDNTDFISKNIYEDFSFQINPNIFGINGQKEISVSTISYLLLEIIYYDIKKYGYISLIGPLSELQEDKDLYGINLEILNKLKEEEIIDYQKGLKLPGILFNPLFKALSDSLEVYIPKVSGSYEGAISFIEKLKLSNVEPNKIYYNDLSQDNIKKLTGSIISSRLNFNENSFGNIYIINQKYSDIRDLRELEYYFYSSINSPYNILLYPIKKFDKEIYDNLISLKKKMVEKIENILNNKYNTIENKNFKIFYFEDLDPSEINILANLIYINGIVKDNVYLFATKYDNKYYISIRGRDMNKELLSSIRNSIDKTNSYYNGYDKYGAVVKENINQFLDNLKIYLNQNRIFI